MGIAQRLKNVPVTKGSIFHLTENVSITVAKDVKTEIVWRLMFAIVIEDIQWWMMSANQCAQEDVWMDFVRPPIHVNVLETAGLSTLQVLNA